jgi:XRE family transcriptional regulator of biofilm formation
MMNDLGQMLKERREELGLTQTEVAELAGISNSFLSQLESGVRRGNNVRTVARLAGALKLRVDDVVGASIRGGMHRG